MSVQIDEQTAAGDDFGVHVVEGGASDADVFPGYAFGASCDRYQFRRLFVHVSRHHNAGQYFSSSVHWIVRH